MAPPVPSYGSPTPGPSSQSSNTLAMDPRIPTGRVPWGPYFGDPAPGRSAQPTNSAPAKSKKMSKKQNPQRSSQAQQLRLTDEQWKAEVDKFHAAVNGEENAPTFICRAWKTLRQAYCNKFDAVITIDSALTSLDPFPFWASENLEVSVLEKVLKAEFSAQLAKFKGLTLLKRIAEEAKLSIWHILLFFGPSTFSDSRLHMLRKRTRTFLINQEDRSWLFTQRYKAALRHALARSVKETEINTSTIPESAPLIIFKTSQMSELAVANPEFETEEANKGDKIAKPHSKDAKVSPLTGIPMSMPKTNDNINGLVMDQDLNKTGYDSSSQSPGGQGQMRSGQKEYMGVQSKTPDQTAVDPTTQSKRAKAGAQAQDCVKGQSLPPIRIKDAITAVKSLHHTNPLMTIKARGKDEALPQSRCIAFRGAQDQDFALPSIEEADDTREEQANRKHVSLSNEKSSGSSGTSQASGQVPAPQATAKTMELTPSNLSKGTYVISHGYTSSGSFLTASQQPSIKEEWVVGSPTSYTHNPSPISRKRTIKEESEPYDGRGKRLDTTDTNANLLEPTEDWDDEIIIGILRLLESIRPDDFIVADGMKSYADAPLPKELRADYVEKGGIIMLPLKMDDGHRLLAVVHLKPIDLTDLDNEGVIQYFDPRGGQDSDGDAYYDKLKNHVARFIGDAFPQTPCC